MAFLEFVERAAKDTTMPKPVDVFFSFFCSLIRTIPFVESAWIATNVHASPLGISFNILRFFLRGRHRSPISSGHRRPRHGGSPRHEFHRVSRLQRGCEYSNAIVVHGLKILLWTMQTSVYPALLCLSAATPTECNGRNAMVGKLAPPPLSIPPNTIISLLGGLRYCNYPSQLEIRATPYRPKKLLKTWAFSWIIPSHPPPQLQKGSLQSKTDVVYEKAVFRRTICVGVWPPPYNTLVWHHREYAMQACSPNRYRTYVSCRIL